MLVVSASFSILIQMGDTAHMPNEPIKHVGLQHRWGRKGPLPFYISRLGVWADRRLALHSQMTLIIVAIVSGQGCREELSTCAALSMICLSWKKQSQIRGPRSTHLERLSKSTPSLLVKIDLGHVSLMCMTWIDHEPRPLSAQKVEIRKPRSIRRHSLPR